MFLTLEGGDGAGKSTQAEQLVARIAAAGRRVHLTREPGGTDVANAIRALLLHPNASIETLAEATLIPAATDTDEPIQPVTEVLLLSAARAQHVARIRAWLAAGDVVVCDRFADSTRAYQGAGRGLDANLIATAEQLATGGLRPDLTVLFDLPVSEGQRRRQEARARGGEWNRLDEETLAFHERVRAAYLAFVAAEPQRWVVFDATQAPDTLAEQIWATVAPRLAL